MDGHPRAPGCDCWSCRPGEPADDAERRCIETVERAGWEVLLVGADGDSAPAFAYTVGLPHRAGHPELLISGLRPEVMHEVMNDVAGEVVHGATVRPGDGVEGCLSGVPLLAEEVVPPALRETVTWSGTGAFAPEPAWPLPITPETLVFTCRHVLDGGVAVCFVAREDVATESTGPSTAGEPMARTPA